MEYRSARNTHLRKCGWACIWVRTKADDTLERTRDQKSPVRMNTHLRIQAWYRSALCAICRTLVDPSLPSWLPGCFQGGICDPTSAHVSAYLSGWWSEACSPAINDAWAICRQRMLEPKVQSAASSSRRQGSRIWCRHYHYDSKAKNECCSGHPVNQWVCYCAQGSEEGAQTSCPCLFLLPVWYWF